MKLLKNVSLKLYSTMRLGGTADFVTVAKTEKDILEAETWAEKNELPIRIIGSGSNIIWRDEGFKGLLVINKIPGFACVHEDKMSATYKIGAGENWDLIVEQLVGLKLCGVEALSLIPGTIGAAPVQNIGAYGQDLSQTLVSVRAYDRMEKAFVTIENDQCAFGYRTSRFKSTDQGRFLITAVTLKLTKQMANPPKYADIEKYFTDNDIVTYTPSSVRRAVSAIRTKKLPDPSKIANCGSFFANPIISAADFKQFIKKHPNFNKPLKGWNQLPFWDLKDGTYKLAAGRLIEEAGFKAFKDHATGMRLWPSQNLVFVNESAKNTQNLLDFEQKITESVMKQFQITLVREPEILP